MSDIRWLHLTDIHVGQRGFDTLWPATRELLLNDLTALRGLCGPWDIIFFTGDLTFSGTKRQFEELEVVLSEILAHVSTTQAKPLLIPIPGNHDLQRISSKHSFIRHIKRWHTAADERIRYFWEDPNHEYRGVVRDAFKEYQNWFNNSQCIDRSIFRQGCLPGDISVSLEIDGLGIGIVGLNSAFTCLADPIDKGQLELGIKQLHDLCEGDPPKWLKNNIINFLMTHHPIDWLNEYSKQQFEQTIIGDGNFFLHLFGHMHENAAREIAENGETPRRLWQGSSLFGLEHYGANGQDRRHGYAAGRIKVNRGAGTAELRVWPRQATLINHRQWAVSAETSKFVLDPKDQGTKVHSLHRLKQTVSRSSSRRKPEPPSDADPELDEYLRAIISQFSSWISIDQTLFVATEDHVGFNPAEVCALERIGEREPLPISYLMTPDLPRVKVLQGESGSGKTSLLRYIVRDLAEKRRLGHHSLIPVFIPLRQLQAPWSLFDYIERNFRFRGIKFKRSSEETLTRYQLLFLLDGYDELSKEGKEAIRATVQTIVSTEKHFIILSTRDGSPFQIQSGLQLRMRTLRNEDISKITAKYLAEHKYDFIRFIHNHDLNIEARNFLLLRLMLSLFRSKGVIPLTKWKIIKATVLARQNFEENRGVASILTWKQKNDILARIAFAGVEIISVQADREHLFKEILLQMENERTIPQGHSVLELIDDLINTGFVQSDGHGSLEFVHRAFGAYFCAFEVARRLKRDSITIEALCETSAFRDILPIVTSLMDAGHERVLAKLQAHDLLLAAECLAEVERPPNKSLAGIARALSQRCGSTVPVIRQESIRALMRLSTKSRLAHHLLYKIAEETKYDDLKTVLFEKLARNRSKRAKTIILKNLGWRTFDWDYWGDSSDVIICALAEFGPKEQIKAFELALTHRVHLVSLSSAISRLASERRLSKELMDAIWKTFCDNMQAHEYPLASGLADCIQAFQDDSYAPRLLELLRKHSIEQDHSFAGLIVNIFEAIKTDAAAKLLLADALSTKDSIFKMHCVDALSRCNFLIPIESARLLIQDTNTWTRSRAMVCLGKHPLELIRGDLIAALHNSDETTQMRAVDILAEKGELARVDFSKVSLTRSLIRMIIKNVEQYSILGLTNFLLALPEYYVTIRSKKHFLFQDDRLMFDLAGAFLKIGREESAERIVNHYLNGKSRFSEFGFSDLAKLLPKLSEKTALRVAKRILRPVKNASVSLRNAQHHCWESIEKMASRAFINMLKKRFHSMMRNDWDRAHYIRALLEIILPEDEPWFLRVSRALGELLKDSWMSSWVLNVLIKIASRQSFSLIREIYALNSNNRYTIDRCYKAIKTIRLRQGINDELTEDEFHRVLTMI